MNFCRWTDCPINRFSALSSFRCKRFIREFRARSFQASLFKSDARFYSGSIFVVASSYATQASSPRSKRVRAFSRSAMPFSPERLPIRPRFAPYFRATKASWLHAPASRACFKLNPLPTFLLCSLLSRILSVWHERDRGAEWPATRSRSSSVGSMTRGA